MHVPTQPDADGWLRITFDGIADIITAATNPNGPAYTNNRRDIESWIADRTAHNGYTPAKLLDAIAHPPAALTATVQELAAELAGEVEPPRRTVRRRRYQLDTGSELDPLAWIQRRPDGWSDMNRTHQPSPFARIGVNIASGYRTTPDQLRYRGAAAVAIAHLYTLHGFSVELLGYRSVTEHAPWNRVCQIITIKRADIPLDIGAAALALSEIGFYRLAVMMATMMIAPGQLDSGVATPAAMPPAELDRLDVLIEKDCGTREKAVAAVRAATARLRSNDAPAA